MKIEKTKIKIVQKENEEPVAVEILAQSILKIAQAVEKMNKSKLTCRAICVLLKDASGESMSSVRNILNSLNNLQKLYLKMN